jgi:Anaphase-promoting complex, subunit 10 (APC10)
VTASSEAPKHPVAMAFDTFTNTDWQATDKTPTIMVSFKQPVDLGAVILHIGSSDAFTATRRPAELDLTFSDGTTAVLKPKDLKDAQTLDLSASKVTWVRISVVATNGPDGAPVSISEIELFKKG